MISNSTSTPAVAHGPGPGDGWSDELAAAHRALSPVDLAFREEARRSPELLDRATFQAMEPDGDLVDRPVQPWPTFVGRETQAELAAASLGVCALLKSVPERLFGNDTAALARAYGLPQQFVEVALAEPNGLATTIARGDFISTAQGWRCIEFNISARLGGWESQLILERARLVPALARFCARESVAFACRDTLRELFAHVLAEARRQGLLEGGELNVAIVRDRREVARRATVERFHQQLAASCAELADGLVGRVFEARAEDVVLWRNDLYLGRLRIHAVIVWSADTPKPVYRSFKMGRIALFNGPVEHLLSNKLALALLSENAERDVFSAAERALIARHVPWTREVVAGRRLDFRGEPRPLEELLAAHREELVLKKGFSHGGYGVAVGRFTAPEAWLDLGRRAAAQGGWEIQELVESLPYLYQTGARGCAPHEVIWGPFVFGDRYAGAFLRMQPKSTRDIVNLSQAASQGVLVEV